ncbi:MAG: hypothetical protein JO110_29105, partial [Acetobacteraceae bacterium]|nr:hypothetical protein [Acetobacteraceae bacterium]
MIFRARAPLRLGLAGGGTDLSPFCDQYGGYVLNATINMHAYAHIETATDGRVRFVAPDVGHEYAGPARPDLESRGPLALHKAVYNRIVQDYNGG